MIPAIEFFQERLDLWISMEAFDLGLEHIVRAHTARLQAVQELHFRLDALAWALSLGQSEEIVLISSTVLSPFVMESIALLQQQAFLYG